MLDIDPSWRHREHYKEYFLSKTNYPDLISMSMKPEIKPISVMPLSAEDFKWTPSDDIEECPVGFKQDQGKSRVDLVVPSFILALGDVLAHGAEKYSVDNWKQVPDFKARYTAAALRHFLAYMDGEKIDPDSGRPHLDMAATNLMFLHWYEKNETEESLSEYD